MNLKPSTNLASHSSILLRSNCVMLAMTSLFRFDRNSLTLALCAPLSLHICEGMKATANQRAARSATSLPCVKHDNTATVQCVKIKVFLVAPIADFEQVLLFIHLTR